MILELLVFVVVICVVLKKGALKIGRESIKIGRRAQ